MHHLGTLRLFQMKKNPGLALFAFALLTCAVPARAQRSPDSTTVGFFLGGESGTLILQRGADPCVKLALELPAGGSAAMLERGHYRYTLAVRTDTTRGDFLVTASQMVLFLDQGTRKVGGLGVSPMDTVKILNTLSLPGLPASPDFEMFDANYFLVGSNFGNEKGVQRPLDEYSQQVKFRVAIRYRLVGSASCPESSNGLYATYGQRSFWHLWDDSAPFFDNNYNPGLLLVLPSLQRDVRILLAVQHESNGRDGVLSRGWNRWIVGASRGNAGEPGLSGSVAFWKAWAVEETNPEMARLVGQGELRIVWNGRRRASLHTPSSSGRPAGKLSKSLQLTTRLGTMRDPFVNAELNALLPLPSVKRFGIQSSLMAQIFSGTGETLLDYRSRRTVVRLGLAALH